jgi:hypothetical protein
MTASPRPSRATGTTGLLSAPISGVFVAAIVAMCGSAFGGALLQSVFDTLTKSDSRIGTVTWLLGGISVRFLVAHALAAEAFIVAYPRLPTIRRQLERKNGTLIVGAGLGTLMWICLRAMIPISGRLLMGITLVSWLTLALFSGPLIVWIARNYVASVGTDATALEARREIGYGWAVALPGVLLLIWAFGTDAASGMGVAIAFVGLAALAVIVVGTSALLGGIWKAQGRKSEGWARATPFLIAVGALILAMALSR